MPMTGAMWLSGMGRGRDHVGQVLAERFTRRIVDAVAMTKIRTDIDRNCRDQLMVLAADQVLHAEIK